MTRSSCGRATCCDPRTCHGATRAGPGRTAATTSVACAWRREAIGYDDIRSAGRGPRADGRYVGVGLSSFVERTGYASGKFLAGRGSKFGAHESVTLRANRSGGIDLYTGVSTFGQSTETAFAQVCSEVLGHRLRRDQRARRRHLRDSAQHRCVRLAHDDRRRRERSRPRPSELRAKMLRLGRLAPEVDGPEAVEIAADRGPAGDDPERRVTLAEVHETAILGLRLPEGETPGLEATAYYEPEAAAFGVRQRRRASCRWTPRPATSTSSAS